MHELDISEAQRLGWNIEPVLTTPVRDAAAASSPAADPGYPVREPP
jgi:hypothetical protein